jgi:hypothetical protein
MALIHSRVVKYLGLNYLWIDTLWWVVLNFKVLIKTKLSSIIQDDPNDWRVESSRMAEVYKHAYCNIAATGATDGTDGLFFNRDPGKVDVSVVYPSWPEASGNPYVVCSPDNVRDDFIYQPLVSRGWVLQERVLARRAIHFTTDQIFWECKQQFACESLPVYLPERTGPSDQEKEDVRTFFKTWNQNKMQYWCRILEIYTDCKLTYASDKLIALSGIAKELHDSDPDIYDVYLAGLWRSQFPGTLLWKPRVKSEPKELVRVEYRAPSWSWASIDGAISTEPVFFVANPRYYTQVALTTFQSSSFQYVDSNIYGQITAACLSLHGPLTQARLDASLVGTVTGPLSHLVTAISDAEGRFLELDERVMTKIEFDSIGMKGKGLGSVNIGENTVYLFMLRATNHIKQPSDTEESAPFVEGLVLDRIDELGFQRTGWFRMALYFSTSDPGYPEKGQQYKKIISCIPRMLVNIF